MNILIVSSPNDQAAGVISYDLASAFSYNNGVCVLTKSHPKNKYSFKKIILTNSKLQSIKARYLNRFININKTDPNYYFFDINESKSYIKSKSVINELSKINFVPNVILVLFYQKFLNFKNITDLSKHFNVPLFFYMMDMAVITGGCHYSWNCTNYKDNCGECPALFSNIKNDQSFINFNLKKKSISGVDISVISASTWTYRQLEKSSLFKKANKHNVLLPVNDKIFIPGNKKQIIQEFGFPLNKRYIFFGSVSVNEKRKGFNYLISALKHIYELINKEKRDKIHLIIAGKKEENLLKELPFTYNDIGFINQDELVKIFQISDLYISPSIEDSGPMMVNQSLMTGTPVVAFKTGVAMDLIKSESNGYLAEKKDHLDLANGIMKIIFKSDKELLRMSKASRKFAYEKYRLDKQTNTLLDIFNLQI